MIDKEELERTNLMKTMIVEPESDDINIVEEIEEFEEKLEYMDISKEKKKELKDLCAKIKTEEDENIKEYLFNLLQKEVN